MNITTPALLFSAISLLMAAYISRFSKLSSLIRKLCKEYNSEKPYSKEQIVILKKRIYFVKYIQIYSVLSLLNATFSIFLFLIKCIFLSKIVFGISLIFFLLSLCFSLLELYNSTKALELSIKE